MRYIRRIVWGMVIIALLSFIPLSFLFFHKNYMGINAFGPLMEGHKDISCQACHAPEKGILTEQLMVQIRYYSGMSKKFLYFGTVPVGNAQCLNCHAREDDRHPSDRFLEPRFEKAREQFAPQFCVSCHLEHNDGKILSIEPTYCKSCHRDTVIKNDPIKPKHKLLFETNQWTSCLRCHDFHGNHIHDTPVNLKKAPLYSEVMKYLEGERDNIYSDEFRWPAKEEVNQ